MRINFKEGKALCEQEMCQKEIEFAVNEAKLQYQADRLATEKELATKKANLEVAMTTAPLNMQSIINLQIEVEGLEDGLKRMDTFAKSVGFVK